MRLIGHLMVDKVNILKLFDTRRVIFSGLLVSLLSCASFTEKSFVSGDLNRDIPGWLHGNCLAIKADIDLNSYHLTAIDLGDKQQVRQLEIGKKTENPDECYALLEDRIAINMDNGRGFYTVISTTPINLGIGIVSADIAYKEADIVDFNNDGVKDTFSYCSTSEGVEFSIWEGVAHRSRLIWSDYYYLGYDSEADCPTKTQAE